MTASLASVFYDGPSRTDHRAHVQDVPASSREQADQQRRTWMAAAQGGDRRAYERVLADSVTLIRNVARARGVPIDGLDDVVQETLLSVHRVRHTYDPSRSYDAWLAAIAGRRSIDALRSHGRRRDREVHDELALELCAGDDDASVVSEHAERARHLRAAIAELPPRQREAVEQLGLKERSLAETAAATGASTGALKVSLHRALKSLRNHLHHEP